MYTQSRAFIKPFKGSLSTWYCVLSLRLHRHTSSSTFDISANVLILMTNILNTPAARFMNIVNYSRMLLGIKFKSIMKCRRPASRDNNIGGYPLTIRPDSSTIGNIGWIRQLIPLYLSDSTRVMLSLYTGQSVRLTGGKKSE